MRPVANASRTGYFIQKLVPHTCNEVDKDYDWGAAFHCYLPYMRLADIYLMYAEACAAFGGASGKSSNLVRPQKMQLILFATVVVLVMLLQNLLQTTISSWTRFVVSVR